MTRLLRQGRLLFILFEEFFSDRNGIYSSVESQSPYKRNSSSPFRVTSSSGEIHQTVIPWYGRVPNSLA